MVSKNQFLLTVLILLISFVSVAGGIRWYHKLNFKVPQGVNTNVTAQTYTGAVPSGKVGEAILRAQYNTVFDNYPVPITAGRIITTGIVGSLALNAVKLMGPLLIANLGILVWDSVQRMWVKPSEVQSNDPSQPDCTNKSLKVIYYKGAYACVRLCSVTHQCAGATSLDAPWSVINNIWETKCSPCASGGSWSQVWRHQMYVPTNPPSVPATDAEILAALTDALNATTGALADFINKLVDKTDLGPQLLSASSSHSLDGTNSFSKTSTSTSTGPDGQTSTTTTTNYNVSYAATTNTVTVNTTTTTTETLPDGSTKTTVTVKTGDNDPTTDDPDPPDPNDPPPEQSDLCKSNPDILACVLLGTLTDISLPEQEKNVSISSEMSAVGTCPADINVNYLGHNFVFSWSLVCSFASKIRPMFLIMTWLGAAIFLFRVFSRN